MGSYTYTRSDGSKSTTSDYRHSDAAKAASAANRAASTTSTSTSKNNGSSGGSLTQRSSGGSISSSQAAANAQALVDKLDNAQTSTVQPVYVSGGSGGNTYRIVNSDGTSSQFAVSGISLAEASQYYADKAAKAQASGDSSGAAKYSEYSGNFAAAANYENISGIRATYGAGTGQTYDATTSLDAIATPSGYRAFLWDTAESYPAGQGLTNSSTVSTFGLMTVPRTLSSTSALYPDSTSSALTIGNSLTESSNAAAGDTGNGFKIGVGDLLKQNDGSTYEGPDALTQMGQAVDAFANLPETVAESGGPLGVVGGLALTCLLPNDLVRTVKKITDGKADEIGPWDVAYSIIDVISLIPVAAPLRLLKVAKAGAVIGGSLGLTGLDLLTRGTADDGDNDKPAGEQDTKTPEAPYIQNPDTTTTTITTPQDSGIMDMLASLFAGSGSSQAGESGGGSSGGEVTVVNNAAEPVDYSKYIIPAVVIIAGALVLTKVFSNKSGKKGAAV